MWFHNHKIETLLGRFTQRKRSRKHWKLKSSILQYHTFMNFSDENWPIYNMIVSVNFSILIFLLQAIARTFNIASYVTSEQIASRSLARCYGALFH